MRHGARQDRQPGQSLVELALVLPALLLVLALVLDIGRGVQAYTALVNAAREGARYGSVHPTDTNGTIATVRNELQRSGLLPANATVLTSGSGAGNPFRVTVTYRLPLILGVVGGSHLTITANAEAVIF